MNTIFFLKNRIDFIRQLYRVTSAPYLERIRKIENQEEPFVPLYYSNEGNGDPPFLGEYSEASDSLDTLRLMYLSMLMSALHSYLKTWIKQSCIPYEKNAYKGFSTKSGWFWSYSNHFFHHFNIDFNNAPVNLKAVEEIILARNNIEHQSSIADSPRFGAKDYGNLKTFSYIDEFSNHLLQEIGFSTLTAPHISVTEEQLLTIASTIEIFSIWFNKEIEPKIYPSRGNQ
ncbi:hypothetical protein [Candidatus Methylomicrobium oryzae]|uniref:hypothetical protein n=1 Tax=Candidatus Methylomicrobium oryzae TaxID=2802053 RepID=UPI00192248C3|nr:hypothetical protein [Methylomicrobium sp. RS1]MBL1264790.1 hypothetical protein [Methylomicrobium sp. RS1]